MVGSNFPCFDLMLIGYQGRGFAEVSQGETSQNVKDTVPSVVISRENSLYK